MSKVIDNLDTVFQILSKILKADLGCGFGNILPKLNNSEGIEDLKLPRITYNIKSRKISNKAGRKPSLKGITKEILDGKETGNAFKICSQWFDCIVEFNIFGRTSLEAKQLMDKFELLIDAYSSYLKEQGVNETFFLEESLPKKDNDYATDIPEKCISYYIGFERFETVKISTLKKVKVQVQFLGETLNSKKSEETLDNYDNIFKNQSIKYDF